MVSVANIKLEREHRTVTSSTRQENMKEFAIVALFFLGITFGGIALQNNEAVTDSSNKEPQSKSNDTNSNKKPFVEQSQGLLHRLTVQNEIAASHPIAIHHHHKKILYEKDGVQPWLGMDDCPYSERSRCELVYQVVAMLENAPEDDEFENFKVTIPKGDGKLFHRVGVALNFKRHSK
ncbi:hypothetical protein PRIPAC_95690 [Pristionchus pacificus]|uniref:Uncharacterized protein n=1 Tax=Pristionchus pacificus TaxID=54126 RepID=A0A2A6CTV1_PRIPA|nr:hypothetical protein PRIPAC_95690 [Pristionchus pacificus]|eukprot:PDM81654.1 hypothetical protein PRIPAC_30635 [Pristionchus pacificus]